MKYSYAYVYIFFSAVLFLSVERFTFSCHCDKWHLSACRRKSPLAENFAIFTPISVGITSCFFLPFFDIAARFLSDRLGANPATRGERQTETALYPPQLSESPTSIRRIYLPCRQDRYTPQRLCAAARCGKENQDGSLLCTSVSVKSFIISASVMSGAVSFFGGEVRMGLPPRFSLLGCVLCGSFLGLSCCV